MFENRADLNWIFNLSKVREMYRDYIDQGYGEKPQENSDIALLKSKLSKLKE